MKSFTPLLTILLTLLLVTACAQSPAKKQAPDWVYNPGEGVVASCGFHIGGHYKQQECATQRARERLAAEQGVRVSSLSVMKEQVVNQHEVVSLDKTTEQQVVNKTVRARVKDTYYDVQRDEYYVWLVPH